MRCIWGSVFKDVGFLTCYWFSISVCIVWIAGLLQHNGNYFRVILVFAVLSVSSSLMFNRMRLFEKFSHTSRLLVFVVNTFRRCSTLVELSLNSHRALDCCTLFYLSLAQLASISVSILVGLTLCSLDNEHIGALLWTELSSRLLELSLSCCSKKHHQLLSLYCYVNCVLYRSTLPKLACLFQFI